MQSTRSKEDISEYVEWQSQNKCKVVSVKPEHSFTDLGEPVHVWNVKTDTDGAWWVVEGEAVPMNLYPQEAYYFSADEAYSFHMGLMQRLESSAMEYDPEKYINALTLGNEIAPILFRKLKNIAASIDAATEIEDFQAIGVQCREILVELGNQIYTPDMAGESEQPQASNFKKKAELFIRSKVSGSENSEYRGIIKKLTESIWDYAAKMTHSRSSTSYDLSSCVSLCISLVSTYENIQQKTSDPLSTRLCSNCSSKRFKVIEVDYSDEKIVRSIHIVCDECGMSETVNLDE